MLPKVATNLLHSTVTRSAAAAVQNQANLRNVLQLHPTSSSSSPSSSSAPGTNGIVTSQGSTSSSAVSVPGSKANAHGGNHGPGSQGKKNKPGSRFYTGYNSAARAVTQANALTSQDAQPADDEGMHPAARRAMLKNSSSSSVTPAKRSRLRSSSVNSLLPRDKAGKKNAESSVLEKPSVLEVVQLQARSLHALAGTQQHAPTALQTEEATQEDLTLAPPSPAAIELEQQAEDATPTRVRSRSSSPAPTSPRPRRNSISSPVSTHASPAIHPADVPLPASPQLSVRHTSTSAPAESASRSVTPESPSASSQWSSEPSSLESEPESVATSAPADPVEAQPKRTEKKRAFYETAHGQRVRDAIVAGDAQAVFEAAQALTDLPEPASSELNVADYNAAFEGYSRFRPQYTPLTAPLELYNKMLERSVRPDSRTYSLLIELFCQRDFEVRQIEQAAEAVPEGGKEVWEGVRGEENFKNAMRLFEAIVSGGSDRLQFHVYKRLLHCASMHGDVGAALYVLGYMEKRKDVPDPDVYRYLMVAFRNSGDVGGAEVVFGKYRGKEEKGELYGAEEGERSKRLKQQKAECWGEMMTCFFVKGEPGKAVGLLETMLKASEEGHATQVPTPVSATYTALIEGFVASGDVPTALTWFNRLLAQTDGPADDAHAPLAHGLPTRPNRPAWRVMLSALFKEKNVDEVNRLFRYLLNDKQTLVHVFRVKPEGGHGVGKGEEGVESLKELYAAVLQANLDSIRGGLPRDVALERLQGLCETHVDPTRPWDNGTHNAAFGVCEAYIALGEYAEAGRLAERVVHGQMEVMEGDRSLARYDAVGVTRSLQNYVLGVVERTCESAAASNMRWNFRTAMDLARLASESLGLRIPPAQAGWLLHTYTVDRQAGLVDGREVTLEAWRILLSSALYLERDPLPVEVVPGYAFQGLASFLEDMASANVPFTDDLCDGSARMSVVEHVSVGRDVEWCREFFGRLGEAYLGTYEEVVAAKYNQIKDQLDAAAQAHVPSPIDRFDMVSPPPSPRVFRNKLSLSSTLSTQIDGLLKNYQMDISERAEKAYGLFQEVLQRNGQIPNVATMGRLIQSSGRLNQLERVQEVYGVAQAYLASAKGKVYEAKRGVWWVQIEDNMIVALAQAGDVEAAHVHRLRILEFSRASGRPYNPSPDAYGALILNVKDTTDDATNALMLWEEALQSGVHPNLYLYNNIISKLARARKADRALEMFRAMREAGVKPSSITYGAMIGACARVGDTVSAEALFGEMAEQRNFKPRVPPFNTMMQMYTATKPNRERALWFYEEMVRQGVRPTVHTYKLLLDIYGSIEPVDIGAMEAVWQQLTTDTSVQINNTHFASLINAYGCVTKDIDRAIATFDSIPTFGIARDAVAYEALINALVANKRTELIRPFMERMVEDNVHMTAYVANFLIKGYANAGDVEQARMVFESMVDPPTGVAAPNNHAPHEPATARAVGVMEPVYREPSTWEAMIRAELGVGNRDRAQNLLDRLRARQYPEAVFNRISGVMVDHSIPPLP